MSGATHTLHAGPSQAAEPATSRRVLRRPSAQSLGKAGLCIAVIAALVLLGSHIYDLPSQAIQPSASEIEAAKRCHHDGGVSVWRTFGSDFVRCDYSDGRSINAAFYYRDDGPVGSSPSGDAPLDAPTPTATGS